jgi:hypothetical protein
MIPARRPALPSLYEDTIIHPSLEVSHIRELGFNWWPARQIMLEDEAAEGKRTLIDGTFYVFLEETCQDHRGCFYKGIPHPRTQPYIARYGIVYKTDHWAIRSVALPLDHPDRDIEPYQMVFVEEEWRKKMMSGF